MTKISWRLGVSAAAALVISGLGAGSASAATAPAPQTKVAWQAAIAHVREPGQGCYRASYPALAWHAVTCAAAPRQPFIPAPPNRSAVRTQPQVIGDGADYSAQVPGLISRATGTFRNVSPGITVQGQFLGSGPQVANGFSLQLNSQFFTGSPACSASGDPASCQAWQQFIYAWEGTTTSYIFMQYWLIGYNATCPSSWETYATSATTNDCYISSNAAAVNTLTASQLATLQFTGSATANGNDAVTLSAGPGQAAIVTAPDSTVDLAGFWNTTEWGVFGDGGGSEAYFGANTWLEPQTALAASSGRAAPTCVSEGFTGETNNLTLTATPRLSHQPAPTMASEQTNGTTAAASCAVTG